MVLIYTKRLLGKAWVRMGWVRIGWNGLQWNGMSTALRGAFNHNSNYQAPRGN